MLLMTTKSPTSFGGCPNSTFVIYLGHGYHMVGNFHGIKISVGSYPQK